MSIYPTKFVKKPVVIEAMQFTNESKDVAHTWITCNHYAEFELDNPILVIQTLEGNMIARFGDWIIKGINGEFYPCKQDIFEKTYEPVD